VAKIALLQFHQFFGPVSSVRVDNPDKVERTKVVINPFYFLRKKSLGMKQRVMQAETG